MAFPSRAASTFTAILFAALPTLALPAFAQDVHVKVDANGPGSIASTTDFKTIQQALDHAPEAPNGRIFIHIVPGTYAERINVTRNRPRVTLLGEGKRPEDVVITAAQFAKQAGGTFFTETAQINGDGFQADNITFQNTAGSGFQVGQAVAVAVRADRAIFKHCRFLGDQDTLFADYGRQYYVDSYVAGGTDFIFGNATTVFDRSEIHEIGNGFLTAQSRTDPAQTTGYVITHSRVTGPSAADQTHSKPTGMDHVQVGPPTAPQPSGSPYNDGVFHQPASSQSPVRVPGFFLGRPWRIYSRVVVMNTELPADLKPAGWSAWGRDDGTPKAFYAEFNNSGPGWRPKDRTSWSHQLTAKEAEAFTPANFLRGADSWNPEAEAARLP